MEYRSFWRRWLGNIIFGLDTTLARNYDKGLIALIVVSVLAVIIESVPQLPYALRQVLRDSEWVFTVLFTLDYLGRLFSARRPLHYTALNRMPYLFFKAVLHAQLLWRD